MKLKRLLYVLGLVLSASLADAALTNSWTNSVSDFWDITSNWSLGVAPSNNQSAVLITNAATKTAFLNTITGSLPGVMTISNLFLSGPAGTVNTLSLLNSGTNTPLRILNSFSISNGGSLQIQFGAVQVDGVSGGGFFVDGGAILNNPVGRLATTNVATFVGNAGSGSLTVQGGTWLANSVNVGNLAGSQGTLTVAGGTNTLAFTLNIGSPANTTGAVWVTGGQLVVTNSSTAIANHGVAQMTVSNGTWLAGDVFIAINPSSQGTLTVAGGTVTILGQLRIADDVNTTGTVWVTGGQLTVTNNATILSGFQSAVGRMIISNGTVLVSNLVVGAFSGAQGTLTIAGGTNRLTSTLDIGSPANATGTVWLTGGQFTMTNDFTSIGASGTGQMTVSNGTWLADGTYVGRFAGSQGTLTIAGGTNTLNAFFVTGRFANATGTVWMTGGQLTVLNNVAIVGEFGTVQMMMSNGTWLARDVIVSSEAGSQGTLTIAGGTNRLSSSLTVGNLTNTTGAVWVTGGQLVVTNDFTIIGRSGVGQMTVSNGTWLAQYVEVGTTAGSQGTLTIAGGTNTLSSLLVVSQFPGATGSVWLTGGQLNVTNGSTLVGASDVGQMAVSNGTCLASIIIVGDSAGSQGTLTVAGGTNTLSSSLVIARQLNSTGTVLVTGGQLAVTNATGTGALIVSQSGRGVYTQNGGTVTVDQLVVTNGAKSVFNLNGGTLFTGASFFTNGAVLNVGAAGNSATLNFQGATHSFANSVTLGNLADSTGTVWMTANQLLMTNSQMAIGASGIGQMAVSNGTWQVSTVLLGNAVGSQGTLTVAGGTNLLSVLDVADEPDAVGTVWMTGGLLTNQTAFVGNSGLGQMTVSNGTWQSRAVTVGRGNGSQGTLTIAGGTSRVFSNLTIGNFGCTATGIVNVAGGSLFVTNAGTAVLEVRSGSVTLSSGTLTIDKLVVTNSCGHFVKSGGALSITSTNLDPNMSAVGDGIPNSWKQQYGFDPFDPNVANADPDGDGMSNLQEFLAGSNPLVDIKSIKREGNDIRVTWQAAASKTNALQRSPGSNGSYSNNFADIFTVTNNLGSVTNYVDTGGATNKPALYYRIRLVP
jgi:hypothetical protein